MTSQELLQRLISSGLANENSIEGCSQEEFEQIEETAGHPLPRVYREFMAKFGKRAGRFLRDVQIFYPEVLALKPIAIEILQDNEELDLVLPPGAFVFAIRQKEQFMCFADTSDNPSIMFYSSGDSHFSKIADSFWDVISDELERAEDNYRRIKGTPYDLQP